MANQQIGPVAISSTKFPNIFLRMDGSTVHKFTGAGGGTVNCQFGAHSWEQFNLVPQTDGTVAIESAAFPRVFLRMDGHGVCRTTGPGGGKINCQFDAHSWEKFKLVRQSDGTVAIESAAFPGVFLRMDGTGVSEFTGPGGGTVNCQHSVGPFETFRIMHSNKMTTIAEVTGALVANVGVVRGYGAHLGGDYPTGMGQVDTLNKPVAVQHSLASDSLIAMLQRTYVPTTPWATPDTAGELRAMWESNSIWGGVEVLGDRDFDGFNFEIKPTPDFSGRSVTAVYTELDIVQKGQQVTYTFKLMVEAQS